MESQCACQETLNETMRIVTVYLLPDRPPHIIHECPTFPPPNDLDLNDLSPDAESWLQRLSDIA